MLNFFRKLVGLPERRGYGYIQDEVDFRDISLDHALGVMGLMSAPVLPAKVDLRIRMPAAFDQGMTNSCVGNAVAAAIHYDRIKQGLSTAQSISRLFIYFNARAMRGMEKQDNGCQIRDAIKSVNSQGAPFESTWPFSPRQVTTRPSTAAYSEAATHPSVSYAAVTISDQKIKEALASGFPVILGVSVYESFESSTAAATGTIPMPQPGEQFMGGHAILIVGYDDAAKVFYFRNSWGTGWAGPNRGYGTLPYGYLEGQKYASDAWVITQVK